MIDIKKAIELFKHHDLVKFIVTYCGEREYKTIEFADVVEALERQISKKPYHDKSDERTLLKCPDCKYIFVTRFADRSLCGGRMSKHCPECGQVIDWSEQNEN